MKGSEPKVAVIIPNWNGLDHILECLQSLKQIEYSALEIVVVDNNSEDGSPGAVAEHFPNIRIIRNPENLGFAGACNVGIKHAMQEGADYVWLLNSDAVVDANSLSALVDVAESEQNIGMTGSKVYHMDDRELLWGVGMRISWIRGETYPIGWHERASSHLYQSCDVEALAGCSFLVKRRLCEEVGLLDEDYFLYAEEIEWCVRSRRHGFRCVVVPESVVFHKGGTSSGENFRPIFSYYNTRNMLWTIDKMFTFPRRQFFLTTAIGYSLWRWRRNIAKACITKLCGVVTYRYDAAMLLGIMDFLRGRRGEKRREEILAFQSKGELLLGVPPPKNAAEEHYE